MRDRTGTAGLAALPAVGVAVYLLTGDPVTAVIGPAAVIAVLVAVATAETVDADVRYVKLGVFLLGVVGGAVMYVSPDVPAWGGAGTAAVSLWLAADTIVALRETVKTSGPRPHSVEDTIQSGVATAIVAELDGDESMSIPALSDRLDVGQERVAPVVEDLVAHDLLRQTDDGYRLHPEYGTSRFAARRFLGRLGRPARLLR